MSVTRVAAPAPTNPLAAESLALAAALLLATSLAQANSTSASFTAGGLVFTKEPRVSIAEEELTIELRKKGQNERQATDAILRLSVAQKNELLFAEGGLNFNDVPTWQKRGVGLYWETYEKDAQNPKTGEAVVALRRRLKRDLELPMRDAYASFVRDLATKSPADES